jgi:manganese/zinc/iron transport system permease protein
MNPYSGTNFFQFFEVLFSRLWLFVKGDLSLSQLASDEVQMLVLIAVALSSALVGTFLVLKRMTMLANSLSHTILLGIVLAYILLLPFQTIRPDGIATLNIEVLLLASLVTGLVTTFLTQFLTHVMKLQEDASIGLVFTTLFALSIVFVTIFTRDVHLGVEAIMGNVDALHLHDLKLISFVLILNFLTIGIFFKEFKLVTFDPSLAASLGFSKGFFNYLLMVLAAATAIGAFRAVGVLLVLAFLVGPPLTARLLANRLLPVIGIGCLVGSVCSILAVALSRHLLSVHNLPLSTAGLVVAVIAFVYVMALLFAPKTGFISKAIKRREWKLKSPKVDI